MQMMCNYKLQVFKARETLEGGVFLPGECFAKLSDFRSE